MTISNKKTNVNELLEKTLTIMSLEIDRLQQLQKQKGLLNKDAGQLIEYAKVLSSIGQQQEKRAEKEMEDLSQLSDEQLKEMLDQK